jgi:hypothetical protein
MMGGVMTSRFVALLAVAVAGVGCKSPAGTHGDAGVTAALDLSMGTGGGGLDGSTDGPASSGRWVPAASTTFFWDLQNTPPDNGRNVGAYDIDGFGNSAAEVTALHAQGKRVVCYMDAGTYEPNRPDSAQFPAALLGSDVVGWPGEKWLDIRPGGPNYATLQSIMTARFTICRDKGFDAVEPDNLDSYQNSGGFNATVADQLAFNQWIAATVHGLGMAVFQKNDLDQIPQLVGDFDGLLDEECNKFTECDKLAPYTAAHKPVWDAEYSDDGESTAQFCAADVAAGIVGALYSLALDGKVFQPCPNDVGIVN